MSVTASEARRRLFPLIAFASRGWEDYVSWTDDRKTHLVIVQAR